MSPYLQRFSGFVVPTKDIENLLMQFTNVSREQARYSIISMVYDRLLEPTDNWSAMKVS